MKRRRLIRHLQVHGCLLLREGANHSVFLNPLTGTISTLPRHSEINAWLADKICKDLDVPKNVADR